MRRRRGLLARTLSLGTAVSVLTLALLSSGSPRPPSATAPEEGKLSRPQHSFAARLYDSIARTQAPGESLVLFPASATLALGLLYEGARGETQAELARALGFDGTRGAVDAKLRATADTLRAFTRAGSTWEGGEGTLRLGLGVWLEQKYSYMPAYPALVRKSLGATARHLDFGDAGKVTATLDAWVARETDGRLLHLPLRPRADDVLVVAAATSLSAGWQNPFREKYTRSEAFHRLDGTTAPVPMMHTSDLLAYREGPDYACVWVYLRGAPAMQLVLPADGAFARVEARIHELLSLKAGVEDLREVTLDLPRFEVQSDLALRPALGSLGATRVFQTNAALTALTPVSGVHLSQVAQAGFIKVDEQGVVAAGVTGAYGVGAAAPPVALTLNRPFLYAIGTGDGVVVMGRYMGPPAGP